MTKLCVVYELALFKIAALGPTDEPGDSEHDSLEEAEEHGRTQGLYEAAAIARAALGAVVHPGVDLACVTPARPP